MTLAVPEGWRKVPLGCLLRIAHGYAFLGEYFAPYGDKGIVTPGNFYESGGFRNVGDKQRYYLGSYPAGYDLVAGDLIVAMTEQATGLLGSAAFVPENGHWLHNQRIGRIRQMGGDAIPSYLFYIFNSEAFRLAVNETAAGTKVKHTSPNRLEEIDVLLPRRDEQQVISDVLDDTATLITSLEHLIAKKQAMARGMMQQLLTGRTRLPGFKAEWQRHKLEDLLAPRAERYTGSAPLEVLSCTKHLGFVRSLDYFKNQVFSRNLAGYRVIRRGDIGYPANHIEEGSIGVQELYDSAIVSPIYVVMRPRSAVDTYFLQRQLKLDYYRQEFARVTNASVNRRGSLRWPEFSQIEVRIPGYDEQRAISSCLRDAEAELRALEQRLTKAREVRQGMMQQLLTGRVRLPVREATA